MMHTWFECKIRYEKTMENGMNKKVTEPYLVDALSFTEAEARIIEEITPFISGEFTVSDIKRANYSELFFSEEEAAAAVSYCHLRGCKVNLTLNTLLTLIAGISLTCDESESKKDFRNEKTCFTEKFYFLDKIS